MPQPQRIAIVGGGWAGMAAAIAHTQAGHRVTVLEAARSVGGRARTVAAALPDGRPIAIDNGQPLRSRTRHSRIIVHCAIGIFNLSAVGKSGTFGCSHQNFGFSVAIHVKHGYHIVVTIADFYIITHVDAPQKSTFGSIGFDQ